jgi:hypothetical protein
MVLYALRLLSKIDIPNPFTITISIFHQSQLSQRLTTLPKQIKTHTTPHPPRQTPKPRILQPLGQQIRGHINRTRERIHRTHTIDLPVRHIAHDRKQHRREKDRIMLDRVRVRGSIALQLVELAARDFSVLDSLFAAPGEVFAWDVLLSKP